jgi:MFS family permease
MKIYYGWVIVAIALLVFTLAIGGSIQAYGLFVLPVSDEFHLSRADANTGVIVLNVGMAVFAPIIGRIVDRHSIRLTMAASAIAFAASYVVLGLSHDLWLSTIVLGVAVSAAIVGAGTVTSPVLVARWFDVHRGRALGIMAIGLSAGPMLTIPVIGLLLASVGWRQCLILSGLGIGAVLLLLALFARNAPGPNDVEPGAQAGAGHAAPAEAPAGAALTLGMLLRIPEFWTMVLSTSLTFAVLTTDLVTVVPYAQGTGLSVTRAAGVLSIYGVCALIGSLLFAWLGDRLSRTLVFAVLAAAMGLASGAFTLSGDYLAIAASTALLGLAGGAVTPSQLALLADRFGAASFGVSSGFAAFLSTAITAVVVRYTGVLYDRTGSYDLVFTAVLTMGLAAALLMLVTRALGQRRRFVTA